MASHILVFWEKDKKFSVTSRSRISDSYVRELEDEEIRNVKSAVFWKGNDKKHLHLATIIDAGIK
jgi:hypothetical protein